MRVTRRKLARILTTTAAAAALPSPAQTPAPTADEDLRSARTDLRTNATRIAQVKLPMSVEPAFKFRA